MTMRDSNAAEMNTDAFLRLGTDGRSAGADGTAHSVIVKF